MYVQILVGKSVGKCPVQRLVMKWEGTNNFFSHVRQVAKVTVTLVKSVHLPFHMEQASSHGMDFHEI